MSFSLKLDVRRRDEEFEGLGLLLVILEVFSPLPKPSSNLEDEKREEPPAIESVVAE